LEAPLRLTASDSGLTIRGGDGGLTILSRGRRITGWTQVPSHPGMWTADLPEVRNGQRYFHQLFVDGQRATRARTPNDGFVRAAGAVGEGWPISMPVVAGDLEPRWAAYPDGRFVMLMAWADMPLPIGRVDSENHIAYLAGNKR